MLIQEHVVLGEITFTVAIMFKIFLDMGMSIVSSLNAMGENSFLSDLLKPFIQ